MATHQLAKGLASLGRHGDSMLMHVSPSEIAGLHALGAMTGRKVTTNPHTGMPEAIKQDITVYKKFWHLSLPFLRYWKTETGCSQPRPRC